MNFTEWLAEQAATRSDEIADFAQGPACHGGWPINGRKIETFEDFVVREFGQSAVKALHRAWNEWQKTKTLKGQESPFGGSIVGSVARARGKAKAKSKVAEPETPAGFQHQNFWEGHPTLDKTNLPMKPPGR